MMDNLQAGMNLCIALIPIALAYVAKFGANVASLLAFRCNTFDGLLVVSCDKRRVIFRM